MSKRRHKRLQYQTYDVTEYLDASNELAVTVGTGWYRGRISEKYGDIHDDPCAIIARLVLSYADGTEETIYTDDGWQTRASKILFSDIYDGETYDATAKRLIINDDLVSYDENTKTLHIEGLIL